MSEISLKLVCSECGTEITKSPVFCVGDPAWYGRFFCSSGCAHKNEPTSLRYNDLMALRAQLPVLTEAEKEEARKQLW